MPSVELDVYGVGHALVDIQYRIQTERLLKLGVQKGIMSLVNTQQQAAIIEQIDSQPIASSSGGSAANTMIGVAMFGGNTFYSCLTGQDEMGRLHTDGSLESRMILYACQILSEWALQSSDAEGFISVETC